MSRRAFTLLEVIIALAILAVGLTVLVGAQATAVTMTAEADRIRVATLLADEKMAEAQLRLEQEGWTEADIEEDGDFADFGDEDFRGDSLRLELGDSLDDYHWAYTVRRIELSLPPDLMGTTDDLAGSGYWGEKSEESEAQTSTPSGTPDLTDLMSPDQITEMLSGYIREVRVMVWWGDDPDDEGNKVELSTHVINPSGTVFPGGSSEDPSQ